MLIFSYQNKNYQMPMLEGSINAALDLDENWRELDYKNGGSSLELDINMAFSLSINALTALYKTGQADFLLATGLALEYEADNDSTLALDTSHLPLLELSLGVNYAKWNFETEKCDLIGNILRYPELKDLENLTVAEAIYANATLWFPGMPISTLSALGFGTTSLNHIDVEFVGHTQDIGGKLEFAIKEKQIPFILCFSIIGHADKFTGMSIDQRFSEQEACAATLYDLEHYDIVKKIIDKDALSVQIQVLRTS